MIKLLTFKTMYGFINNFPGDTKNRFVTHYSGIHSIHALTGKVSNIKSELNVLSDTSKGHSFWYGNR
jgi:hypothetical protein